MQDDPESLSQLIGDIYDCALDARRWVPTLARVGTILGACNGQIMGQETGGVTFFHSWGTDPVVQQLYRGSFAAIDPVATADWHFGVDEPFTLDMLMPRPALAASRFHREFLQPLGWHDFIMTILRKSSAGYAIWGYTRDTGQPVFGPDEIALMRRLAPHVRRAVMLHGAIVAAPAEQHHGALLDAIAIPALVLDGDGTVLAANLAAAHLLAASGALRLTRGALAAGAVALRRDLAVALAAATGPAAAVDPAAQSFGFAESDGRRFAAHVVPVGGAMRDRVAPRGATCIMFVQEVGTLRPLPGEVLVRLYGMTPAETQLLAILAQGQSLRDAAATLGIALSTARTHLQRLFDKTATRRQAELVRLVLSALPPAPPPAAAPARLA